MSEKDKNCIEFSMHSMIATHKPYQEDTEIAITGLAPGKSLLLANNPFDIPCDVVVVSKSMANEIVTANEDLWSKNEKCEKRIESLISKCTVLKQELKILTGAIREWKEGTGCPSPSSAKTLIESMNTALRESNRVMVKELENSIDEWQKATGRISPEAAKQYIDRLKGRLNKIHDCSVDW